MKSLAYFQPTDSFWKDTYHPKWAAPFPTQSSTLHYSNRPPSLSFSASSVFSSILSQQDLLSELWTEPHQQEKTQHMISNYSHGTPFSQEALNSPPHYEGSSSRCPSTSLRGLGVTALLLDSSLEYAQSLLPHSLLMPLTQENLYHHKVTQPIAHNKMFVFDAPDAATAPEKLHMHKARNASVSSSSSSGHSSHSKSLKAAKSLNTQLYKTELCLLYMKTNVCPYGSKCQFAHGDAELKTVERPSNWRSKPCANWARYGLCRYGKRCCFKHGE